MPSNKRHKETFVLETAPKIEGLKCRFMHFGLFFLLSIVPILISLYVWYAYDLFYAVGSALFLYIVSAIIGSKLRVLSLPPDQLERSLNSFEIARWYVGKYLCP